MIGAYVHDDGPREKRRLQDRASTLVELLHADTAYPEGAACWRRGAPREMRLAWRPVARIEPGA